MFRSAKAVGRSASLSSPRRRRWRWLVLAMVGCLALAACDSGAPLETNEGRRPRTSRTTRTTLSSTSTSVGPPTTASTTTTAHDHTSMTGDVGSTASTGGAVDSSSGVLPPPTGSPTSPGVSQIPAWNDPAAWAGGRVPSSGEAVTIPAGRKVRLTGDVRVAGLTVDGELYFDPSASATLSSSANVVVSGLLQMKPGQASVNHVIEFTGVKESSFAGGGMSVLATDTGLWVMGKGQLLLEGTARRAWTNATGSVAQGATSVTVKDAAGWQVGDRISVSPTAAPGQDGVTGENRLDGFDESSITAINGSTLTLSAPLGRAHPQVDGHTAEVINLTRNVEIRGTSSGRAHVFVHADSPQFIRWVSLRYLGVTGKLGRYPLHLHHAGMGTTGSLVEGVIVNGGGNHAFVPHESHGVTLRDIVAYGTSSGDAVWWDEGDHTSDLLIEHALAAGADESGFYLGAGSNMTLRDSVAVGIQKGAASGGFEWDNGAVGDWKVDRIVAHNNNASGIRVWQNSSIQQVVDGYDAYHNSGAAIDHGAYTNRYVFRNGRWFGNKQGGAILWATSRDLPIRIENTVIDAGGVATGALVTAGDSAVASDVPTVFRNVTFKTSGTVFDFEATHSPPHLRCIDCTLPSGAKLVSFGSGTPSDSWLETVASSGSKRYSPGGSSAIDRPVSASTGNGTGLLLQYFNNPDLSGPVYAEVLPAPAFEWEYVPGDPAAGVVPYHLLSVDDGSSSRLTGSLDVAAGDGGAQTLYTMFSGGIRVWIDGAMVIDNWSNTILSGSFGSPGSTGYYVTNLKLGEGRHDLKIELKDPGNRQLGGIYGQRFSMAWEINGRKREVIPAYQLSPPSVPSMTPVVKAAPVKP